MTQNDYFCFEIRCHLDLRSFADLFWSTIFSTLFHSQSSVITRFSFERGINQSREFNDSTNPSSSSFTVGIHIGLKLAVAFPLNDDDEAFCEESRKRYTWQIMIKSRRDRRPGTIARDELPRQSGRAERFCTPSDGPVTAEKNTRSRVSVRRRGHGTMACHAIGRAKTWGSILPQQGHGAMACHTSTTK